MAKERSAVTVPAEFKGSLFMFQHKDQDAKAAVSNFATGSSAIITGTTGVIGFLDYKEVQGANVPRRTTPQIIVVNGEDVQLADVGQRPWAPTIGLDVNAQGVAAKSMTLGLLQQSELSTIKFKNKPEMKTTDMQKEDLDYLASGTVKIKCLKFWKEGELERSAQYDDQGKEVTKARTQKKNCYQLIEID